MKGQAIPIDASSSWRKLKGQAIVDYRLPFDNGSAWVVSVWSTRTGNQKFAKQLPASFG